MHMSDSYSDWLGKPVILHVVSSELNVPLRCTLLNETEDRLRVRIDGGWDVDIYKQMVHHVAAVWTKRVT